MMASYVSFVMQAFRGGGVLCRMVALGG